MLRILSTTTTVAPLSAILNQIYPVHIFLSYFSNIGSNIILSSMPRSSKWSFPFSFFEKKKYTFLISSMHTVCPVYITLPGLIILVLCYEDYKLLSSSLRNSFHLPFTSFLVRSNSHFSNVFAIISNLCSSLSVGDQLSHPPTQLRSLTVSTHLA